MSNRQQFYDGDTTEQNGRVFRINIERDDHMGAPWNEHDGHGIVRESNTPHGYRENSKYAGEWPLNQADRRHTQFFYDFAATIKKATKEGWGLNDDAIAKLKAKLGRAPTKKEIIAESVRRDFEYLRGWLNDDWEWCGVIVTDVTDDADVENDYGHAVWGCESGYTDELVHELISEHLFEHEQAMQQQKIKSRFADAMECGI